jgi:nucleoside-diphosphate-sugar epimerase
MTSFLNHLYFYEKWILILNLFYRAFILVYILLLFPPTFIPRVNVDAALALFKAAASDSSPVLRMVHLSSASACLRRLKTSRSCAGLASWLGLNFLDSLLGGLELSTYGRSKREGEMKLLEIYNDEIARFNCKHQQESSATMPNIENLTNDKLDSNLQSLVNSNPRRSNPIKLVILRPHVVWGRGDPMATDALLAWPGWLPVVIVGDAAQEVTSVHVALLARYILLADYSLKDGSESDRDRDSSRSNCNNSGSNSNNMSNEGLDAYKYGI